MARPAMWVTRQIATHTGRIVALIDYLSAVTPPFSYRAIVVYVSHRIEMSDPRLHLADDPRGREETAGKEPRLRPNVGRSEVRLSRWTSLRRFQTSPRSFLLLTKENVVIGRSYGHVPRYSDAFPIH